MSMPPTFARDFRRTLLWIPRITFPVYLYGSVTLSGLGVPPRLGLPLRRASDHRFLAPTRRISQLGTSFVGARAEPFPRQHVSHCPIGLAHVQDVYDRYQWTLSDGAELLQRPLPFPFERPRTSRVHVRLRAQNGMPIPQSPRS